jgi:hypothetical protein
MKAYLVVDGAYYENSDVTAGFFDKQKAIEFMKTLAEKKNSTMQPDSRYKYVFDAFDLSWRTPNDFIELQEIEIV